MCDGMPGSSFGNHHASDIKPFIACALMVAHPACVAQVWVYGNSFESSLVGVVVPSVAGITAWAKQQGIEGEMPAICADPKTKEYILAELTATAKVRASACTECRMGIIKKYVGWLRGMTHVGSCELKNWLTCYGGGGPIQQPHAATRARTFIQAHLLMVTP